jgi:HSP20 family protein
MIRQKQTKNLRRCKMLTRYKNNWALENPWADLMEFQRGLNRLFDGSESMKFAYPEISYEENDKELILNAAMPGFDAKDINLELLNGFLTISAKREAPELKEGETLLRSERSYGEFRQRIKLGAKIKADKITANYKNGMLTITLPKEEAEKPRTIKIN